MGLGQLLLPSDEVCQLLGEVVGYGVERPEGREIRRDAVDVELDDMFGSRQILQTMKPAIAPEDTIRKSVLDQFPRRP